MSAIDPSLEDLVALDPAADTSLAIVVSSIDGVLAKDGHVGELTGEADQAVLLALREQARAVVVGAETVRAEGYGGLLGEPARERRRARGLPADPELAIVSRTGHGLPGTDALTSQLPTIVWTTSEQPVALDPEHEHLPSTPDGQPDLGHLARREHERRGHGPLIWEGGPTLVRLAISQGVLDQLCIAFSPQMAARGVGLLGPELSAARSLTLLKSAASGGFVFARYAVAPPS